ncbi:Peptidyl-prolyl cis-trans isomerase CYP57 [Camellia lanceoleosa]|uniref:Peptidyl-prolyl cis-trans isomerase CYP57 n=1 Tax=Camellia lanceoleosa TaxID=1840588 RepID=A0ACC0FHC7_9ERIC|nr:Peptidyl-prolyl cis-trans isomerase CYP57 [Camellia lanceoleosa]
MSSVYVSEPPTKGKVILNTTYGLMDIELWPQRGTKAVRNFVQLCMEGYYENTIFHRIIKSFLVQGGDPLVLAKTPTEVQDAAAAAAATNAMDVDNVIGPLSADTPPQLGRDIVGENVVDSSLFKDAPPGR